MEDQKDYFQELFEYSHQKNAELIEAFLENKNAVPDFSLKVFSHILNAHQIWNFRMLDISKNSDAWKRHDMTVLEEINNDNFRDSRIILQKNNLEEEINYNNSKKIPYQNRVKDILFHVINHSTYHRGQIAMDFRQNGLEPLVSDYIFYKR